MWRVNITNETSSRQLQRWLLAGICGIALCLLSTVRTYAAPPASITYQGISLTPAIVQIPLKAGDVTANFTIQVTNNTKAPQTLAVSSLDFRSLNETGGLTFIGNDVNNKHGLASWLDGPTQPVSVAPGATNTLKFMIENRSDLAPGGHYAAILFEATNSGTGKSGNHVALNQVVSTLVFVSKLTAGAKPAISFTHASTNGNLFKRPDTANIVFRNTGNLQSIPRGLVVISSPFSHELERGIINTDSSLLLPDATRLYQVPLHTSGNGWWLGHFHGQISYRYGGQNQFQTARFSFWYINPFIVLFLGVIVVVGGLSWRYRQPARKYLRKHEDKVVHIRLTK